MNIYLVCTGNTCRSPMAEAILRAKNIENVTVRSAGIHAQDGIPIADNAKTLIEAAGMPYTAVSRAVKEEDVEWADYIFTMTDAHKAILHHLFPEDTDKIFTLKGFIKQSYNEDVHDPYGGNLETYEETFSELSIVIDNVVRKLNVQ
ncbi:low molecular weight protein arginine phosphatase [Sporosarcina sp. G11-34]|uniref:low molecular weight protein arginine phosphatase n=1 Tax=Sporosarcina sp. G11-34 TaxID=2849605 RepID=UPI0022A8FD2F|nr:low molecular weight protein arginine phosphatase [Sporosarcina sp. G11-34]MCZ2258710.1 low molecular weight protein arginine phosphatase [Sporosarcina sp. G11-34]